MVICPSQRIGYITEALLEEDCNAMVGIIWNGVAFVMLDEFGDALKLKFFLGIKALIGWRKYLNMPNDVSI